MIALAILVGGIVFVVAAIGLLAYAASDMDSVRAAIEDDRQHHGD